MIFGKKKPASNRRKHNRVSLCRLVKIRIPEPGATTSKLTNIFDFSESGLRFHVIDVSDTGFQLSAPGLDAKEAIYKPLLNSKKGDMLVFCLKLDPESPEISMFGRLAWVVREVTKAGHTRLRAGVEFIDVSKTDHERIKDFVTAFNAPR